MKSVIIPGDLARSSADFVENFQEADVGLRSVRKVCSKIYSCLYLDLKIIFVQLSL